MPDQPVKEPAHASEDSLDDDTSPRRSLLIYVALALAVIAVALAALAYFHPKHQAAAGAIQQNGDAKINVCAAADIARKSVVINTHLTTPENNPLGELAVAANARLALVGGGTYLHQRIAANTAAPADVTKALNALASTMEQLGVGYLAGGSAEALEPLRKELDTAINLASKVCS